MYERVRAACLHTSHLFWFLHLENCSPSLNLFFSVCFFAFLSGSVRAIFLEHVDRLATIVTAAVIIFNPIRAGMSFFFGKGQIDLPTSSGYE